MSTELPTTDAPAAAPAPVADGGAAPPAEASAKKTKKPVDPDKRERDAAQAQLRRELVHLKETKAIRKAADELKKLRGAPGEDGPAELAPPAAGASPPAPAEEPGQLPGWPKPSEIAAQREVMLQLWGQARDKLAHTRYGQVLRERTERVEVLQEDGTKKEVELKVNPVVVLADGTSPLAAQLLGKVAVTSPTAQALITVGMVFGPPLVEQLVEVGVGLFQDFSTGTP